MKFTRALFLLVLFTLSAGCIKSVSQSGLPKLEAGKPTGTIYIGYHDKTLPSGTRVVLINGREAFSINMGQYVRLQLNPGNYTIRLGCVGTKGFSGTDSPLNTGFQVTAGVEQYFMIKWNAHCKKLKQDDIYQVLDKQQQAEIKSYKLLAFEQGTKISQDRLDIAEPPCCEISGAYRHQEPLKGRVTIKQNGADLEMSGHDLIMPTFAQIQANNGLSKGNSPTMKIVAKLQGEEIKGEWWYEKNPAAKKPFNAKIGKHAGRKDKVIYVDGEMAGVWYKVK